MSSSFFSHHPLILASLLLLPAGLCQAQPDSEAIRFFELKIRPLLAEQCFDCHGKDKQKGDLRLDHIDHIRAGGSHYGPAISDSDPTKSPLLLAIQYTDPELEMPPEGKLSSEQIDLLKQWVAMGAPWPEGEVADKTGFKPGVITAEDRAWWAFQPVKKITPPSPAQSKFSWINEIDLFVQDRLTKEGLSPAAEASGEELIRRVTFDLHGLPPTPEALRAFVTSYSNATNSTERQRIYENLIDELLASPRYGERWAQHWLDLARYAESEGYRQDGYRPNAWPYRDYVIQSFNDDKPYDQFIREQIAGDEIAPDDPKVAIGTAFLRHGIYEYNQRDAEGQWELILNEVTGVTADVFMGLSVQCAQCHDHKFDPILQKDYYQLQAFLNNITWPEDRPLATPTEIATYEQQLSAWRTAAAAPLNVIDSILEPRYAKAAEKAMSLFPEEVQAMYAKPKAERTPYEEQVVQLAYRQAALERTRYKTDKIPEPDASRLKQAQAELAQFDHLKPKAPLTAFVIGETGLPPVPASFVTRKSGKVETQPGFLTILDSTPPTIPEPKPGMTTSGRRSVLADWLAKPTNPLTTRVIVNRIWQYHFGRGIVATGSDFGRLGELPTHPELLDWLTSDFIAQGWHLKPLHKKILLSATYRQTARRAPDAVALIKDPENKLLWRFPPRRLSAEEVRDTALAASAELSLASGGEGQDAKKTIRSIYTKKIRNTQDEVLRSLDAPSGYTSTPQRDATTTATQSLLLFNGDWPLERARAMAARLTSEHYNDLPEQVRSAYELAFSRSATANELREGVSFLKAQASILTQETPPPPPTTSPLAILSSRFPDSVTQIVKSNHSLNFQPGTPHEKLRVKTAATEGERFFVEAVITLDALYPDATVRTIVSRWNNGKNDPGWAFGVTSQKSAYQPNNLIMQLSGEDFQGTHAYEVVASDLRIPTGKAHYVAASINNRPLEGRPYGGTITFYSLDLTDPAATMQSVTIPHEVVGGYVDPKRALVIGGRETDKRSLWDGGIVQVVISNGERKPEWKPMQHASQGNSCVANIIADEVSPTSTGDWVWESSATQTQTPTRQLDASREALIDFCHALINSNEFFYLH
jgi:hypothetical protein